MSKSDSVHLDLPLTDAEYLVECLSYYHDEGPSGEGWQSDELSKLVSQLEAVITKHKEKVNR